MRDRDRDRIVGMVCHNYWRVDMTDETRIYNCGGIPVELTLPEGELKKNNYLVPFQDVMHAIYKYGDRKT